VERSIRVGRTTVVLGPGRAFGSGDHETTGSCLRLLESLGAVEGGAVLDVGCGTGALAIAALKLGARWGVAFDADPEAARTTRANAILNGVSDRLSIFLGDVVALGLGGPGRARFDLILANLYGDLLLRSMDSLSALLAPGGHFLMSGICWEDRYEMEQALGKRGIELRKTLMLEAYVTLLGQASG
jgi:ribosomal protein L11 methyltransferase